MTAPTVGDNILSVPAVNVDGKQIPVAVPTGIAKVGNTVTLIPTGGGQTKYAAAVTTTPAVGDTVALVPLQGGGQIKWAAVNGGSEAGYQPGYILGGTISEAPFRLAVDAGYLYVGTYGPSYKGGAVFKLNSSDLTHVGELWRNPFGWKPMSVSAQGGYVYGMAGGGYVAFDSEGNYLTEIGIAAYYIGGDCAEIANWGAQFWIRGYSACAAGLNPSAGWAPNVRSGGRFFFYDYPTAKALADANSGCYHQVTNVTAGPITVDSQNVYLIGDHTPTDWHWPPGPHPYKWLYIWNHAQADPVAVITNIPSGGIPGQIASDGAQLYLCDPANHRVIYMDLTGAVLGAFGTYGTGPGHLNQPIGIAVDGDYLYIANYGDWRIQKFLKSGEYVAELPPRDPYKIMVIPVEGADRPTIAEALAGIPAGVWTFTYSTTAAPGTDWNPEPNYGGLPWPVRDCAICLGAVADFMGMDAVGLGCPVRASVLMLSEPIADLTQRIWHELLHGVTMIENPDTLQNSTNFITWMAANHPGVTLPAYNPNAGYPTSILLLWNEYLTGTIPGITRT